MWRYEILAALAVGMAVVAIAEFAEAGDKNRSTGNYNNNRSSSNSHSMNFQNGSNKWKSTSPQNFNRNNSFAGKFKPFPTIDPGIGNGKQSGHHHHDDHHSDHHDHHSDHHDHHGHHHHHGSHIVYFSQPYPIAVPVRVPAPIMPTIPSGGPNLVNGVNLVLVDIRMVDAGDPTRNLGPRYRIVVGNRGNRAAGNFQVMAIASTEAKFDTTLPHSMNDIDGIAPGQVARVDMRLPMESMTMIDGNPFNILAVMVDAKQLIDETAEQDNAGMMEREKIELIEAR